MNLSLSANGTPLKENGAFITDRGVLILPNTNNDLTTTDFNALPLKTGDNGLFTHVKFNGQWLKIYGLIHTHVKAGVAPDQKGMRMPSEVDWALSKRYGDAAFYVFSRVEVWQYINKNHVVLPIGLTKNFLNGNKILYR
jgi:hypothetical protein